MTKLFAFFTSFQVIIPQLFSRLNHHEPYVRKRVSELLCRVASDSPHLIIFPAVVGADKEHRIDNVLTALNAPTTTINSALTECFNSLLDTLSKQASERVKQVQVLVHELKRISLLWEELWLAALTQIYSEHAKRMVAIETELKKLSSTVSTEPNAINDLNNKYCTIARPVIDSMERLLEVTSVPPETPHEANFQEKYSSHIRSVIESLRAPLTTTMANDSATLPGWQKFRQLHSMFEQRAHRRTSFALKMSDISPILGRMNDTEISMPGIERQHDLRATATNVYIRSVENAVQVLPTKTKPKKLAFRGSDGLRYTYLFKSQEDLHLDERIMQFLSIANSMMAKTRSVATQSAKYRAKHYSVIPLGHRSGLISWVDGMTPIFTLYKKWQQRQASSPKKEKNATPSTATAKDTSPAVVLRPSEMFYKKLAPLLAKHNLKTSDNRKEWPVAVLKEVLAQLTTETPCDLLAKELWCYSTNAAEWRQVIRNYSQSVAVMSVIGYVIGLGDRHLDNILIDLSTGEILHIDYNVCFEKGKTLRVPEKVPFRMTPNIEEALGVTGIEVS